MEEVRLRAFQRRFVARALAPHIDTSAISLPRGNGKSFLCSHIVARALTPGDPIYEEGREIVLISASLAQARFVYKFVKGMLAPLGIYRWHNSTTAVGARCAATGTELRCLSSNPRTILGLVGTSYAVIDEPSAFEVAGGEALWDSVSTALGKPNSRLRVLIAGTRSPSRPNSWWLNLLDAGSNASTFVQQLRGDIHRWDSWREIRRVNPLIEISPAFRRKLLEERDAARRDERLKARFLSFRLNVESQDESVMLISVPGWQRVEGRSLGSDEGVPCIGIDLGGGRAWSSAVALFPSGRVSVFAVTSGLPGISDQEKRDAVPRGTYERLINDGTLLVDDGRHVPRVSFLVDEVVRRWPTASLVAADRFRYGELQDAFVGRVRVAARVTRWSESSQDIRAFRELALDGNLSVEPQGRAMMRVALAAATVENDTAGNSRLVKRGSNQSWRDDPAHALVLAAGLRARMPAPVPFRLVVGHRVG